VPWINFFAVVVEKAFSTTTAFVIPGEVLSPMLERSLIDLRFAVLFINLLVPLQHNGVKCIEMEEKYSASPARKWGDKSLKSKAIKKRINHMKQMDENLSFCCLILLF
jgi:hypothetical protein